MKKQLLTIGLLVMVGLGGCKPVDILLGNRDDDDAGSWTEVERVVTGTLTEDRTVVLPFQGSFIRVDRVEVAPQATGLFGPAAYAPLFRSSVRIGEGEAGDSYRITIICRG